MSVVPIAMKISSITLAPSQLLSNVKNWNKFSYNSKLQSTFDDLDTTVFKSSSNSLGCYPAPAVMFAGNTKKYFVISINHHGEYISLYNGLIKII